MRVDEHTFHLDESPVYYRSADASGMPKLYLHGIPTSSDDWVEFLARTGGVAPDLIGFGRSGKGGQLDYSLRGLANFVERFLRHVRLDEIEIVGHDWGAAVALVLCGRQPTQLRRLVLINPPPLLDLARWPLVLRLWRTPGVGELLMGATTKGLLARALRRGSGRGDAWSEERIAAVWRQFDQGTQRAILRLVRSAGDDGIGGGSRPAGTGAGGITRFAGATDAAVGADAVMAAQTDAATAPLTDTAQDPPAEMATDTATGVPAATTAKGATDGPAEKGSDALAEAPAATRSGTPPVTIVWGENDPWYPPAVADDYAARLPGATVERIAGAGHWPWMDRPEVVDCVAALLEG